MCGGSLDAISEVREVRIGRRAALVREELNRCDACGEELYAPGQLDETMRRASDAIRQEEGLLSSDAIRRIREGLGLSQAAFEKLLGVGPKTVVRWEKGTVFQNRSTDSLLRVIDALPDSAAYLARLHGVQLRDHPDVAVR
jgi:HTH-type transcriptional regulator/antitoxin MqsA